MAVVRKPYRLDASKALFELATECLRLGSNARHRLATFDDLISDAASAADDMARHDPTSLRDHLAAMPAEGDIVLQFELGATARQSLEDFRCQSAPLVSQDPSEIQIFSMLFFAYLVEQRATLARATIEAMIGPAPGGPEFECGSVVPFKR